MKRIFVAIGLLATLLIAAPAQAEVQPGNIYEELNEPHDTEGAAWTYTFSGIGSCPVGKDRKINIQGRPNASALRSNYTYPGDNHTWIVDGAVLLGDANSRLTENDIAIGTPGPKWQFMFGMWANYDYDTFYGGVDYLVFDTYEPDTRIDLRFKITKCKHRPQLDSEEATNRRN